MMPRDIRRKSGENPNGGFVTAASLDTPVRNLRLLDRALRTLKVLQTTRRQRGTFAAGIFLARTLFRKGPLLVRHLRAVQGMAQLRANVRASRQTVPASILQVGVMVSGGLGDMLVIGRFLRDLGQAAPGMRLDIFMSTPGMAAWAFREIPGFRGAYHDVLFDSAIAEYDVALRISQFVVVYSERVRSETLQAAGGMAQAVEAIMRFRPEIDICVNHNPWLDNHLARIATFHGATRRDFLHKIAAIPYGGDRLTVPLDVTILTRLGLQPGSYVTIHNGFDTGFLISGRQATKCYPHFSEVVALLKEYVPGITFVQIGAKTSLPIEGCDLMLIDRTTLDEAAGLIANAAMHIDNEGGLVHLASCVGVKSVVVFGPTPIDYFGYPSNVNVAPPVCGECWWMKPTWMDSCVKGYEAPSCMTQQSPRLVAEHARRLLLQLNPAVLVPKAAE